MKHEYGFVTVDYDAPTNVSIPSLVMGDGSVGMFPMYSPENGTVGVCFTEFEPRSIGSVIEVEEDHWEEVKFQILTDNPKSLDVLIEQLLHAKDKLIKLQKED